MSKRAALAFLLAASPAFAGEARVELHLNGLFAWGDFDFSETRSFRVLGRELPVTAAYDLDSAFGIDVGLQVNVAGPIGLRASLSHAAHAGDGTLSAALPPLLPGLPERVEISLPDGRVEETAVHLAAVLSVEAGQARFSALGGITFFDLNARLVESVGVSVPGTGSRGLLATPGLEVSDSPVGWNVGVGIDLQLARNFALGGFVRYSRATAELRPPAGNAIELEAGGAHSGAGLRLLF